METAFMGIDPGASGACVVITSQNQIHEIRFTKSTDKEIWQFIENMSFKYNIKCVKEKVWAMPATNTDGSNRSMGASTSFTFGENNGKIIGFLVAAGIPYEEKVPQTWQKIYGMKKEKNESQTDFKKRLRQKAEQLYPNHKITADTADAILIAHFCRQLYK